MLSLIICLLVLSFMYYSCVTKQKPDIWATIDYAGKWLISKTPGAATWMVDNVPKGAEWVVDKTPGAAQYVGNKVVTVADWTASQAPKVLDRTKNAASWVSDKSSDVVDNLLVAGQWSLDQATNIKNPLIKRTKDVPASQVASEQSQPVGGKKDGFTQDIHDTAAMFHLSKNPSLLINTDAHKRSAMSSFGTPIMRPLIN